jgi:hypothetical protein
MSAICAMLRRSHQAAQLFADRGCLFNAHQKFSQKKGARRRL